MRVVFSDQECHHPSLMGAQSGTRKTGRDACQDPDKHPYHQCFPKIPYVSGQERPASGITPTGPVRSIKRETILRIVLAIIIIAALASATFTFIHATTPVRIGVLLPLTGDIEIQEPLEWAQENINRHGGIGTRPLEFVYKDTGRGDTVQLARELLDDESIRIIIGPPTSDDVYLLTPEFARKGKVLISPYTTSGDIIRAFGKTGYFWRTTQGDVAQVNAILTIIKENGARRVALLSENTTYGRTFYDWTGFFATEYGLELTSIQEFEPETAGIPSDVRAALETDPEYLIAACGPLDAAEIKKEIDRSGKPVRLILSDAAQTPALLAALGPAAEGITGTSPTADPTTGFSVAYQEKFGHAPADYAAPAYDAVLLAAYTAARQDAVPLESLADSVRAVVYGSGERKGWDAQEVHEALQAIRSGRSITITGASGPLAFDTDYGVDPLVTYYAHTMVEDGAFRTVKVLSSAKAGSFGTSGESVSRTRASGSFMDLDSAGPETYVPLVERSGFRAVVVGPSSGWKNYRHQSDALAVYTMLKEIGIPDDHIILLIYDDVPLAPENPLRGDIHNTPKGSNLRPDAVVDYAGSSVTARTFRQVLEGRSSAEVPVVLDSTAGTDVFVYIASHGLPGGVAFSGASEPFTAEDFTEVTTTMYQEGKYRRMVFFVDTCFGESVALNTTAKGLLYFTGSAATEPSRGAVYDMDIRQWLSDEFTQSVLSTMRANPDITFRDLYIAVYEKVTGSHVRMLNTENFGNIDLSVREFLRP